MKINEYDIKVDLGQRSYIVHVGHGNHGDLPDRLRDLGVNKQIAIISTPPVSELYLSSLLNQFDKNWYVRS